LSQTAHSRPLITMPVAVQGKNKIMDVLPGITSSWMRNDSMLRYNQRNGLSTQRIINAHYNQRLFPLCDLTTKIKANTYLALSVRALFLLYSQYLWFRTEMKKMLTLIV
jgi:hypothetical protein